MLAVGRAIEVSELADLVTEDLFTQLMSRIHEEKRRSAMLAKKYYSGSYDAVTTILRDKWGYIQSYLYEDIPISPKAYRLSLLALMVTEHVLLRVKRDIWSHMVIAIVGPGGAGKTTYVVNSCIGALMNLGLSFEEAVERVKPYVFFRAKPFIDFIEERLKTGTWMPFVILDDIGTQISKYWIFLGEKWWVHLFRDVDQAKEWTNAVIMTARNIESIPAKLRDIIDLVAEMKTVTSPDGSIYNLVSFYRARDYRLVSRRGSPRYIRFIDASIVTAKMPEMYWMDMISARRELGLRSIEKLRAASRGREEGEPGAEEIEIPEEEIETEKEIEEEIEVDVDGDMG